VILVGMTPETTQWDKKIQGNKEDIMEDEGMGLKVKRSGDVEAGSPKINICISKNDLKGIEKYSVDDDIDFHVYGKVVGIDKEKDFEDGEEIETGDVRFKIDVDRMEPTVKSKRIY